ncbi:GlxA family transcriptional regulator [Montanilutibacter psychrotolerans]|uniref:Helix-turn-helix domain-containing protein n=1 Tax=Montanilutibacter psychrotolerans TaxID=1327343 RepID=A0A3M8SWN8_9GAMM|nr:helix-turn-helix domain-containing protein [Lysobacter psychrotolerans]RNF85105.1 helix-turn-helix domain-containing protein [Lysobacter psychrotolerans]
MLAYAGAQSLDITGPLEVFALASRQAQEDAPCSEPLYRLQVLSVDMQPIVLASGMRLLPDMACGDMTQVPDTLLVCGGMGDALDIARADATLVHWLRTASMQVRRVASVCSGALLLAEAGLLDDREATTHWSDLRELRQRYPRVRVQPDAIYTRDGEVWTSAGITTGMDMALAMVAADHGQALALKVAKRMVMASKRSGGQSQFSRQLQALDLPDQFAQLARWIPDNLCLDLSVGQLAQRMHMSPRQFCRRFMAAFSATPQKYVEQLRVEAAKPLLESSRKDIKRIADECGFGSADTMRRTFVRLLGVSPAAYRARLSR